MNKVEKCRQFLDYKMFDERFQAIIDNYDTYPPYLIDALFANPEILEFVINYPQKKGRIHSHNVGTIREKIPLLLQWDERWGYAKYGDNIIGVCGCGPTALAMVIAGLTHNKYITPYVVARFVKSQNLYQKNSGTNWKLMTAGSSFFNVHSCEIENSKEEVFRCLKEGHPIICSVHAGDFTSQGHFIVLVDIVDGKIKVNDPNSKIKSSELWYYKHIKLQIKCLWEFWV